MHFHGQHVVARHERVRGKDHAHRARFRRLGRGRRGGDGSARHAQPAQLGAVEVKDRAVIHVTGEHEEQSAGLAREVEVRAEIVSPNGRARCVRQGEQRVLGNGQGRRLVVERACAFRPRRVIKRRFPPRHTEIRARLIVAPALRDGREYHRHIHRQRGHLAGRRAHRVAHDGGVTARLAGLRVGQGERRVRAARERGVVLMPLIRQRRTAGTRDREGHVRPGFHRLTRGLLRHAWRHQHHEPRLAAGHRTGRVRDDGDKPSVCDLDIGEDELRVGCVGDVREGDAAGIIPPLKADGRRARRRDREGRRRADRVGLIQRLHGDDGLGRAVHGGQDEQGARQEGELVLHKFFGSLSGHSSGVFICYREGVWRKLQRYFRRI
jgi:hypothetical protein